MAAKEPEIVYSHPVGGHETGDREAVSVGEGRRLVHAGMARPATKSDGDKLGVDPERFPPASAEPAPESA